LFGGFYAYVGQCDAGPAFCRTAQFFGVDILFLLKHFFFDVLYSFVFTVFFWLA